MEMLSDDAIAGLMLDGSSDITDTTPCSSPRGLLSITGDVESHHLAAITAVAGCKERHLEHSQSLDAATSGFAALLGDQCDIEAFNLSSLVSVSESSLQSEALPLNSFAHTNPFYDSVDRKPAMSTDTLMLEIDCAMKNSSSHIDANESATEISNEDSENVSEISDGCDERYGSVIKLSSSFENLQPEVSVPTVRNTSANTCTLNLSDVTNSRNNSSNSCTPVFVSPARSPVNRPCCLPLIKSNNCTVPRKTKTFLPEHGTSSASRCYAETVVVDGHDTADEGGEATALCSGDKTTNSTTNSDDVSGVSRSGSPDLTTPAYAPLYDALESPLTYPMPDYPPPPLPRNLRTSSTSSSE